MSFKKIVAILLITVIYGNIAACSLTNAKKSIENTADTAKDAVVDAGIEAKDKVVDAGTMAKDKIVETGIAAKDKAVEVGTNAKDVAVEKGTAAKDAVVDKATAAKDTVVDWYSNLDFSKFKDGWDYSVKFMGAQYSAVVSSEYVTNVENAISTLKTDLNSSVGSTRGTAQEAGYLAEKWVSDTFNINAAVNGSKYQAKVEGSNKFGSVDVSTNYGENASLKYYADANSSASKQATSLIEAYHKYVKSTKSENPPTLEEYMTQRGYDAKTQDQIMASIYEGQTRIIPTDQLAEATDYLNGKISKLSSIDGEAASARTKAYQETLKNLSDRLHAPDGTESIPLTREQAQAIAELSQKGEFKPEDFNVSVTSVISPKYVVKQAVGTGLEVAALNVVFTAGPDIYSVIKEAVNKGEFDEEKLKEVGIESAIAGSEGFVEGSVSQIIVALCKSGKLGSTLKGANSNVVATLTILAIEAAIHGYELSQGKITAEEYGNLMIDRLMISLIALPTTALVLMLLPSSKIWIIAGCMAGGMIACVGYTIGKEAVMDMIDAGGLEAIIPKESADSLRVAKEKLSSLNIKDKVSSFKDSVVSTAKDGYIKVSTKVKTE